MPTEPKAHFLPSTQIEFDKFASSNTALVIFAPVRLASNKFAPLKEAEKRLLPSKLTLAKLELSKILLLQLANCKFAEKRFELLKFPKTKFPKDILALFNWDFSKLTNDKFTPVIIAPARETPDKSVSSIKLQLVQSTSLDGTSPHSAIAGLEKIIILSKTNILNKLDGFIWIVRNRWK